MQRANGSKRRGRPGAGCALAVLALSWAVAGARAASPGDDFVPCGGKDGRLWAWGWAGEGGSNLELAGHPTDSGPDRVWTLMRDLSGNGRHFYGGENFDGDTSNLGKKGLVGRGPGYQEGLTWKCRRKLCKRAYAQNYETDLPVIGVHRFKDTGNDFWHNVAYQREAMDADGPFYLAFAGMNSRTDGKREIFGSGPGDWVAYHQGKGTLIIRIAGKAKRIDGGRRLKWGPVVLEVYRDAAGGLHSWVNGEPHAAGEVTLRGTFGVSGLGFRGVGTSYFDDYAFEYVMCKGDVAAAEREATRRYLNAKWAIYPE